MGLGLALRWIHIYLRPLHRALQLFWLVGCLGFLGLGLAVGPGAMATSLAPNSRWIWAVGPSFAALAGIGFKEVFCFQLAEAIGLTLLPPTAPPGLPRGLLLASPLIPILHPTPPN